MVGAAKKLVQRTRGRLVQGIGAVSQVSPKTLSASTEVVAAKANFPNRLMRISDALHQGIVDNHFMNTGQSRNHHFERISLD